MIGYEFYAEKMTKAIKKEKQFIDANTRERRTKST